MALPGCPNIILSHFGTAFILLRTGEEGRAADGGPGGSVRIRSYERGRRVGQPMGDLAVP